MHTAHIQSLSRFSLVASLYTTKRYKVNHRDFCSLLLFLLFRKRKSAFDEKETGSLVRTFTHTHTPLSASNEHDLTNDTMRKRTQKTQNSTLLLHKLSVRNIKLYERKSLIRSGANVDEHYLMCNFHHAVFATQKQTLFFSKKKT